MQITGYFDGKNGLVTFGFEAIDESHAAHEIHNRYNDKALGADLFAKAENEGVFNSVTFRNTYENIASLAQA